MDRDLYECEPMRDALGRWRLVAIVKACGAQPFWLSDKTFRSYADAVAHLEAIVDTVRLVESKPTPFPPAPHLDRI